MTEKWHFDRNNTFCISVDTALERQVRMRKRFDYFSLDAQFFPAASKPEDFTDQFVDYLSIGQRGCAQSHLNVWRHIIREQLPYALIVEDDAMFDKNWRKKMDEFYDFMETQNSLDNWHAIFLNCSEPISPKDTWTLVTEQYLTGGYVISLQGAKMLLEIIHVHFSGILYGSDWTTTRLQAAGKSWSYFPWLIIQEGIDSMIGSGVEMDHAKVIRCLEEIGYDISENYV